MIAEVKPTSTQSIRLLYIVSKLIFSASIVFSLIISSVLIFGTINSNSSLNDLAIEKQFNLSTEKFETLKKETIKYLDIFKDHPYIFNLGHGVLPETDPNMFEYMVNTVKDY